MDSAPDQTRAVRLTALAERSFDVLVVGGGITGAGIARDAALRGLAVAVVDKGDWASGTSSKSSKLVHGGLRYLESYQLGLVLESTRERHRQARLNPHLVRPVPFAMPIYRGERHSLAKINAGMWLYDLVSLFRAHKRHRRLGPDRTAARIPGIRREGLKGCVHYWDYRTDDARLTLANVLDAERHGATAVSYVRFDDVRYDGGRVSGAALRDVLADQPIALRCKHIVYAGGPWTDELPDAHGGGELLRRTKGIHILVPHARLPLDLAVAMAATRDRRATFALPFGNTTYIGTTETDFDGDIDDVHPTADDVAYLLETVNAYFPGRDLVPDDVRSTWGGVRPLVRDDAVETAYRTSREHVCATDPAGITTIAGGKLTTYRAMAEEAVDAVAIELARHHGARPTRCRTARTPLDPDARALVDDPVAGPPDPLDRLLWHNHGGALPALRERIASRPGEAARVDPSLEYVAAQVAWAVLHEHALTLEDVLVRRLQIFYRSDDQGLTAARPVAAQMAALLGRGDAWIAAQIAAYERLIAASRACVGRSPPAALAQTGPAGYN